MEPNKNPINNNEAPKPNQSNLGETENQAIAKKPRKIIIISIISFLIIAGLAGAFYFSNTQNKTGIEPKEDRKNDQPPKEPEKDQGEFSYSECKGGDGFSPDHIKEVKWDKDRLIVKAITNRNCAVEKLSGNREVNGDRIVLAVEATSGERMAMCDCGYDVEFNIKDLIKKDYNISFNVGGKEVDWLNFNKNGEVSDSCDQDRNYSCYAKNIFALQNPQLSQKLEEKKETKQKEFIYDSKENKRIAESNPDFLRLFKKYEHYTYDSDSYDTIYLSYDKENQYVKLRAGNKGDEISGMETGLISDVNSFQEGISKYVAEKKSMESPNSLEAQLKTRLGIEITLAHENEAGFDFVYENQSLTYSGPFEGYPQKGNLRFNDRAGGDIFRFLDEFPQASQLDNAQLLNLIDISNRVYEPVENNDSIDLDSVSDFTIKPSEMKARFFAKTNPEVENNLRHVIIHSFELPIKDPIQKRYELNINSGELKVLTGDENVDEF